MNKLLGTALGLALVLPAAAQADLLKNLTTNGEIETVGVRARNLNNVIGGNTFGQIHTRLIWGASWDLLDDVAANVTLTKTDRNYGAGAQTLTGGTGVLDKTLVNEANVKIKNLGCLEAKVGRQVYGNPGDLVIYFGPSRGPVNTATAGFLPVAALDAIRLDCTHAGDYLGEGGTLHVINGKTAEAATKTDTDTDVRGIAANWKLLGQNWGADVYEKRIGNGGAPNMFTDNLWVLRVKGNGDVPAVNGLSWKAQVAVNRGDNGGATVAHATGAFPQYRGYAYTANLTHKWSLANVGGFNWGAELNLGSGDSDPDINRPKNTAFAAVNSDFRPGDIYGGQPGDLQGGLNPSGLTNRVIYDAWVSLNPDCWKKLSVALQGYKFQFQETATGAGRNIGSELDIRLGYAHSENVNLGFSLAQFYPGDAIKALQPTTYATASRAGLDLAVKF